MPHSIAGKWRGHYSYPRFTELSSGFDAFFTEISGSIEGTIHDDFDPGEATLSGSFSFPSVQFTKVYVNSGEQFIEVEHGNKRMMYFVQYVAPIEYEGTMSDDGKTMSGSWVIANETRDTRGSWTAHRLEEKEKKKAKEHASPVKVPALEEL